MSNNKIVPSSERGKPTIVQAPEGYSGAGFMTTSLEKAVGLARKNSIWPLPFATSCCGIEFMATMGANYDLARFGMERLSFSPRQSDLLMVMGTIAKKMAPILKEVYTQMAEPKWVLSVGACASSGGIFDTYSVLQGIDRVIPVDVYVPGCPPRPEQIIDGVMKIQELVGNESLRRRYSKEYEETLAKYKIDWYVPAFAINADRDQLVTDQLAAAFGDQVLKHERLHDMLCITLHKDAIHAAVALLQEKLDFNFLTTLCGMHYADRDALGLVIHLHSMRQGHRIRLKAETPMKEPVFPTFTDLWPAANWMERETFDFFGIRFTGHPDLRRILNMEDFPAFPMRKDYPLEDPTREDKDDSYFGR